MEASAGSVAGVGHEMLLVPCGSQLVREYCFKMKETTTAIDFMLDLLHLMEENDIAMHSPIVHRFSTASSAFLAPNYSENMDDRYCFN